MTEQDLQNLNESPDAFWDYVNELAEKYQVTCDYILEEFLLD